VVLPNSTESLLSEEYTIFTELHSPDLFPVEIGINTCEFINIAMVENELSYNYRTFNSYQKLKKNVIALA